MSHPTAGLDDVVHQRARLGILAILARGDRIEFSYLKEALGLSPGNLSRHLTTLVEARMAKVDKGYQGRRPRTWVSITKVGRRAFDDEMTILRSLLALDGMRDGEQDRESPSGEQSADHDQLTSDQEEEAS